MVQLGVVNNKSPTSELEICCEYRGSVLTSIQECEGPGQYTAIVVFCQLSRREQAFALCADRDGVCQFLPVPTPHEHDTDDRPPESNVETSVNRHFQLHARFATKGKVCLFLSSTRVHSITFIDNQETHIRRSYVLFGGFLFEFWRLELFQSPESREEVSGVA